MILMRSAHRCNATDQQFYWPDAIFVDFALALTVLFAAAGLAQRCIGTAGTLSPGDTALRCEHLKCRERLSRVAAFRRIHAHAFAVIHWLPVQALNLVGQQASLPVCVRPYRNESYACISRACQSVRLMGKRNIVWVRRESS